MDIHNSIMAIYDIFHMRSDVMVHCAPPPPPPKKNKKIKMKGVRFSGSTVIIILSNTLYTGCTAVVVGST